ncbi:MAG: exopolysaccharide biosynthesis polyprenyl glycosylphosphotransferase [Bacteroidota bacterium]
MSNFKASLRRNWRTAVVALAIAVDSAIVLLTYLLATLAEKTQVRGTAEPGEFLLLVLFTTAAFLIFSAGTGVYRTISHSSFQRQLYSAGKAYLYTFASTVTVAFLFESLLPSRLVLLLFFLFLPLVYSGAWAVVRARLENLRRRGYGSWNTLAIGSPPHLGQLLSRLNAFPHLGYQVNGVIDVPEDGHDDGLLRVDRPTVERALHRKSVDLIAFSTADLDGSFDQLKDLCREEKIAMRVISPESDHLFSRAGLHDHSGISLYSPEERRIDRVKQLAKRAFDVVASIFLLMLSSPLLLMVAIATKLESRGPVIFRQKRSLSDHDARFSFYKFRSMVNEADEQREALSDRNETSGALFKIKDDPRLTRTGRFIRRHSFDELPQLVNVLKGDMSLVGPRPLPTSDFTRVAKEDHMSSYYRQRGRAKPGMTGLWQISGRSELGFQEMVLLDLYYVEHQTLLFDLEILARTIPVVLLGKGAY